MDTVPIPQQYDPRPPVVDQLPLPYVAIQYIESGEWDRYLSRISAAIRTRVVDETPR